MCAQESDEKLQESVLSSDGFGGLSSGELARRPVLSSLSHLTRVAYVNTELAISLVGLL